MKPNLVYNKNLRNLQPNYIIKKKDYTNNKTFQNGI